VRTRAGKTGRDRQHRRRGAIDPSATHSPKPIAEKPDLLIDCATLTGAARIALGPELRRCTATTTTWRTAC
jgi:leucyl aminopeptidase